MERRISGCRGCLLGLAVGDAMGHTVDEKSWQEIQEDYGPNGLLGYDLVNDSAVGSAYTQVAAYACIGLFNCHSKEAAAELSSQNSLQIVYAISGEQGVLHGNAACAENIAAEEGVQIMIEK